MRLTIKDNNRESERIDTMEFDNDIESFIKKNSFDKKGRLIMRDYYTFNDVVWKKFPSEI